MTTPRFRSAIVAALVTILAVIGCASPINVKTREDALRLELAKAKAMGAMDCSPEELARSESQLDFAMLEIGQGDYIRAEDHLEEGFRMAKAAQRGVRNCKQAVVVAATPTPTPVVVVRTPTPTPTPTPPPTPPPTPTPVVIIATPAPTPTPQIIIVRETPPPTPTPTATPTATPEPTPDPSKIDGDKDGLPDLYDDCPEKAGPRSNRGCPVLDADGDGIPDDQDKCPGVKGVKAYSGCPPPDRDGDGVVDDADDCPGIPGVASNRGCPEFKHIVINKENKRIELKQTIHFASGKAIILRDSFPILDEIIAVLRDNETMEVRIEGHTDSDGSATLNLSLSKSRADSVASYLIRGGIPRLRLRPVGLGETTPIASNQTPDGKALNRRVEFHITKD